MCQRVSGNEDVSKMLKTTTKITRENCVLVNALLNMLWRPTGTASAYKLAAKAMLPARTTRWQWRYSSDTWPKRE